MQFLISCKPPSLPRPSGISMVPRYPTYKKDISLFVLAALSRLDTNQAFGLRCSNIDVVSPCLVSLHALAKFREVLRKEAGELFPTKAQLFSTSQVHFASTTSSSLACVSFTCNFLHPGIVLICSNALSHHARVCRVTSAPKSLLSSWTPRLWTRSDACLAIDMVARLPSKCSGTLKRSLSSEVSGAVLMATLPHTFRIRMTIKRGFSSTSTCHLVVQHPEISLTVSLIISSYASPMRKL